MMQNARKPPGLLCLLVELHNLAKKIKICDYITITNDNYYNYYRYKRTVQ